MNRPGSRRAGVSDAIRSIVAFSLLLTTPACRRSSDVNPEGATPSSRIRPPAVEDADVASRPPRGAGRSAPVLWLGLDGLDLEILDRLAAAGRMPNWKRLSEEGFTARLRSFLPLISPILWTTAATGVGPDQHRVLDFQEVDPATGAKVPISGNSRAVPAVWNRASEAGRSVGVVGWWATHPAEEVRGFFVTDRASPILFDRFPLSGVAYPVELAAGVGQVVEREGKVEDADLARFVNAPVDEIGRARSSGAGMENPIVALARILAATRVNHRIARDLYDRNRPDLLALYLEGTDEIGHVFATDAPPRLSCASEADWIRYGRAADEYYALVDRLLGQWMRRAAEDGATLVLHSDHGFKWGADRPCRFSSNAWTTAAYWHRLDGVFAAWGARVRHTPERGAASLFDIAPTILALLGVPAGSMPGNAIASAFPGLAPLSKREALADLAVRRVEDRPVSREQATEYSRKLLALGYLSGSETQPLAPPGGARPGMTEGAWNNLGVYERDTRRDLAAARSAFARSLELRPGYYSAMYNVALLERSEGRLKIAREWLFRALSAAGGDPAPAVMSWSHEYQRAGKIADAESLLEEAVRAYPDNEEIARDLGLLLFRGKDCAGAWAALSRFETGSREPRTFNDLALFQTCLGNRGEVLRLLERSLALNPDQPEVARSLTIAREAPG